MPVPLPSPDETDLTRPGRDEVALLSAGIIAAAAPTGGLTPTQELLIRSVVPAMTGLPASLEAPTVSARQLAVGLAQRNAAFRSRIVQNMVLLALVLRPIPVEVADRVAAYASELGVDDTMLEVARRFAEGHLGLAAVDFERNGYTAHLDPARTSALHMTGPLNEAWDLAIADDALARRWEALEQLPEGSIGRGVSQFYLARGFVYPGRPGSAPPLLAQHDWVHVLADYGSTVESELEVFAFIARANDEPSAFSLLAMVVCLFETGYLATAAGLFEAAPGHLSETGMAARVADALRRGALCAGSIDFMTTDWFALAAEPVDDVRRHFGVPDKSPDAIAAGSVGPWQPGGISPFQVSAGTRLAAQRQRPYQTFGASPLLPPLARTADLPA